MAALSVVLARLANSLADQRVRFGARPLDQVASILSFLEAAHVDLDDQSATAAVAAAVLSPESARRLVVELGAAADLVPDLKPTVIGIDHQLARIVSDGSRQHAIVAASMLFAFYHDAARRGDERRMEQLRSWIGLITVTEINTDLVSTLSSKTQETRIQPSASTPRGSLLFSISIDLVGSTDAKSRVRGVAKGEPERIDGFNAQIYKRFCQIEEAFYRSATDKYGAAAPIDLSRFFAVKGIGDEIWILCDVPPDEAEMIGKRLIDSALQIAAKSVDFFAVEHEDDPMQFDPHFDYGAIEPVHSPIKLFIDAIEHASDLGKIRDDHLLGVIPEILERLHGYPAPAVELAEVVSRLCFGTSEALAWSRLQLYRTDYIGHEIDRFFRSTKAALPGTLTIGKAMAERLALNFSGPDGGVLEVRDRFKDVLRGGEPCDPIYSRSRTLTATEMKGIGYPYEVYTLFAPRALNGLYKTSSIHKEQRMPTRDYTETQKILSPDAVQSAATLCYPK